MSDDSESVSIESEDISTTTLTVPGSARRVIFYLLIVLIPCACLATGIIVWARRRHK